MCEKYYESNLEPCGLADEYIVPKWNVDNGGMLKLPDSISFDEAAMIEPLACCIRSWNKFKHKKGDTAVVLGVGPTGIMHVMLAAYYEFKKVFCLDLNDFRLAYAKKFDAVTIRADDPSALEIIKSQTGNKGVDLVIIATGNLKALLDAINFVRKGGTIIVFGVPSRGDKIDLDMSYVYSKNITIINTYAASDIDTKEALEMISTKKINVKQLITHKYNLSDVQKAFEHAKTGKDAMKIIINN
jgi:L-iditol 2-dehydrogenase